VAKKKRKKEEKTQLPIAVTQEEPKKKKKKDKVNQDVAPTAQPATPQANTKGKEDKSKPVESPSLQASVDHFVQTLIEQGPITCKRLKKKSS